MSQQSSSKTNNVSTCITVEMARFSNALHNLVSEVGTYTNSTKLAITISTIIGHYDSFWDPTKLDITNLFMSRSFEQCLNKTVETNKNKIYVEELKQDCIIAKEDTQIINASYTDNSTLIEDYNKFKYSQYQSSPITWSQIADLKYILEDTFELKKYRHNTMEPYEFNKIMDILMKDPVTAIGVLQTFDSEKIQSFIQSTEDSPKKPGTIAYSLSKALTFAYFEEVNFSVKKVTKDSIYVFNLDRASGLPKIYYTGFRTNPYLGGLPIRKRFSECKTFGVTGVETNPRIDIMKPGLRERPQILKLISAFSNGLITQEVMSLEGFFLCGSILAASVPKNPLVELNGWTETFEDPVCQDAYDNNKRLLDWVLPIIDYKKSFQRLYPDSDIDIAVYLDCPVEEREKVLAEKVKLFFEAVQKNSTTKLELKNKNKTRYTISGDNYRNIDLFSIPLYYSGINSSVECKDPLSCALKLISTFHHGATRIVYDGDDFYMLPSTIMTYYGRMSPDYRYAKSSKTILEIIKKYHMRGFGTLLNLQEAIVYSNFASYDIKRKNNFSVRQNRLRVRTQTLFQTVERLLEIPIYRSNYSYYKNDFFKLHWQYKQTHPIYSAMYITKHNEDLVTKFPKLFLSLIRIPRYPQFTAQFKIQDNLGWHGVKKVYSPYNTKRNQESWAIVQLTNNNENVFEYYAEHPAFEIETEDESDKFVNDEPVYDSDSEPY